jgi:hypothetical protein
VSVIGHVEEDKESMSGYSGTPLPKKLGIAEGDRVAFPHEPGEFRAGLGKLPDRVTVRARARGPLDVIVAFFTRRAELERSLDRLIANLDPAGGLWIAWPKRSSGVETDITEDVVRDAGVARGLVDNKVCAIDETWSALRLVMRLRDRPGATRT